MTPSSNIRALVLTRVAYGDNSLVLRCFTAEQGLSAFMVYRSKKGAFKPSMLLPLTCIEAIVNPSPNRGLGRFTDVRPAFHWQSLHTDPVKMTLCTFYAEVLGKVVPENHNEALFFDRMLHFLREMDRSERTLSLGAHEFLLLIAHHIGCLPQKDNYVPGSYFDMLEGTFRAGVPEHSYFMSPEESALLHDLLLGNPGSSKKGLRTSLLDEMIRFIRIHHEPLGKLQSLDILREILA